MEKTVTLRFYDVRRRTEDRPAFADVVRRVSALDMAARQKRVGNEGVLIRLEDFDEDDDTIFGQFVRGQSGNRPGRMLPDRTGALPFDEPLGHGVAFRYRLADGLLAIEYNPVTCAPSRVMSYLYEFDGRAEFEIRPRMRDDAWAVFEQLPTRKVKVAIAGHPNPGSEDDPDAAVWASISDMKDRYGADTITFEISRGRRGGVLTDAAKDFVRAAFQRHEAGQADVRTIKSVLDTGEGAPNEEIDLMGEFFNVKAELDFPHDDWERFYELRRELLNSRINLL